MKPMFRPTDDKDPLAAPALNQLGGKDAGLKGFSKSDGIRNEDALAGLTQRLERRVQLVGCEVRHAPVTEVDTVVTF